jgi:pilus assembly protein CpaE
MEEVARVVLALEQHDVAEEVMHFLDRTGRTRVVATAADEHQLSEAVRQLEPDAVVASPGIATSAELYGSALLALDTAESVQSLRQALRAGAKGFYLWPADRGDLARAAARAFGPHHRETAAPAPVIAVYGPRGGVGATFLAPHLAAAIARRGRRCLLVDLDLAFADLTVALGVSPEEEVRTIADAVSFAEELTARHLDGMLLEHPNDFRALLAPPEGSARATAGEIGLVLEAARGCCEVMVLHVPRGMDEVIRLALRLADRIAVVLGLDVLSFRAAKRALDEVGVGERCEFVVNRPGRSEIATGDVERVFGRAAIAVIPFARGVAAAQDRGRLMPARSRVGRAVDRLAGRLLEGLEEEP